MLRKSLIRGAVVVVAGVAMTLVLTSEPALSRKKKKEPTPTVTATPTATATPEVKVWNFDSDKAGAAPAGWKALEDDWQVIPDPSAPSPPNTYGLPPGRMLQSLLHGLNYNSMTIEDEPMEYTDFTLEASFKAAGGRFDCTGGIVFRYVDPKNFYLLSAGCPSDYFTFARVTNGTPDILHQSVVPTDRDIWYKLKIVASGGHFMFYDDNKMIFDFDDNKIAKGKIGLYASNDSQARFDNVTITLPLPGAEAGAASPAAAESPAAPH
jgi:3-keto-disaccharide hydrolase